MRSTWKTASSSPPEDSFEFAAALFGAWHAGKTVYLPADALASNLQRLAGCVDGFAGDFPAGRRPDASAPDPGLAWHDPDPEAPLLVLYTSGSQGEPAAIGKCLRQLDSELGALEQRFGSLLGNARVHGTVSHQHIYGLLFRVLWPLAARRPFARHRLGYPEQVAALSGSKSIVLVSSPALLKRLPDAIDWSGLHDALSAVFSSGGPLPAEAGAAVERLWGHRVIEVLGSTETGGIASRCGHDDAWKPLPGVEVRIDDHALCVRSRHLPGSDWVRTEDRASASDDGFRLQGRADRLVKLEERRISLQAIERALRADALVDEARVIVLEGARDRVAAVVVLSAAGRERLLSAGRKACIDGLRNALRSCVDPIALPKRWRFVDALPGNAQGKTSGLALAELFASKRPVPQWQERGTSSATLDLAISKDLLVFDGHFPGTAILPGVAMIDWAIAWASEAFGISTSFLRMEALKFQQLVRPGAALCLDLQWRADTGALAFAYRSARGTHASGRIIFASTDAPP